MVATPSVITFDDIQLGEGQEARLQQGYAGFNWTQAGAYNPDGAIGGYGASSGQNLAFIAEAGGSEIPGYEDALNGSPFVVTRSTAFNLVSADFSAAFRDDLSITVNVYADEAGATLLGTVTFTADRGVAQTIQFDEALFSVARRVEFTANDGDGQTADYFGIDNLTVRDVTPTVLDFDDIALAEGGETAISEIDGFQVSGVGVYNPDGQIAGYQAASGRNTGFLAEANGDEIAGYEDHVAGAAAVLINADGFEFLSGSFSAAFRDDLDVTITAFADVGGQTVLGTAVIRIDQGAQTVEFIDGGNVQGTFRGATRLEFSSNDGNGATSDYFGFDDLTFLV